MRPLKLTMTAFGPYKHTEVIDFNNLKGNDLYVISGNTGAGKTTIFDGICFALYGSASGEDRENHMMLRSDFADDDTHTSVELEFELKGRKYRILRQLGHVKQGNKSKTGDNYEFFELVEGSEIPCVDRQIVSEINRKVESLIGLTEDQFKQIVMLPQGEFRKLLTSETENKEDILRRLFKTDNYKQMSDQLRHKKTAAHDVFNRVKQTRDTYIQHIEAVLPNREGSKIFEVLQAEHFNVNQVLEALGKEINFYRNQIQQDEIAYQTVNEKEMKMQETVQEAKALNERFKELAVKEAQLKSLTEKIPVMKQKEWTLKRGERASQIEPEEARLREWRADLSAKEKQQTQVEQAMTEATERFEKAQQSYEREEKNNEKREEITKELTRLKEFYPLVEQINQNKQALHTLRQTVVKEKQELEQVTSTRTEKEKTLEANEKQILDLEEKDRVREAKNKQYDELKQKVKYIMAYLQVKKEEAQSKRDLDQKKQAVQKAKEHYQQLETSWLNNQAVVLASHLHDGKACPVCGSLDHPEKASSETGDVSREQLEHFKQAVEQKETTYQHASNTHSGQVARLADRANDLKAMAISLDHAEQVLEELSEQGTKLKDVVTQLNADKEKLDTLKKRTYQLQEELKQFKTKQEAKDKSYQDVNNQYTRKLAIYNERIRTIPEELQDMAVLQKKWRETKTQKQTLEKNWEAAQKNLQAARENVTKAKANVEHAKTQCAESQQKRDDAEKRFHEALEKTQFETEALYREAKLERDKQNELQEEIKQFNQQLATTQEQVRDIKTALKDKEQVDLHKLEKDLEHLREANKQALRKWNQSIEYCKQATTIQEKITESTEKVRESEHQLNLITDLHDVIRGQNSKKISFERYLQIDYLDQIIEAANHRLRRLSNGQYSLIRSDRQESHGKQSGLALDVYDEYTGQTRDVKSLSGGEKFNASLCLALGMSDVIQSFQGNISIETMFIDEGFGSLDEEALNKSIDTLIDLQQTGRSIGVISHVKELKSIFPAVLEVNKTKEGYSETQFVVK